MSTAGAVRWSAKRRAFIRSDGSEVSAAELRALVLHAQAETGARLAAHAEAYLKKRITLPTLKLAAWRELKNMHTGLAAVASGGFAQMSARADRQLQKTLAYHGAYLNDLARGLERGSIKPGDSLASRLRSYSAGAWATFENVRRVSMHEGGIVREQRVLGTRAKSHCDVCKAQAALGVQARGVLRPIGDSPCGNNCDCTFAYPAVDK